MIIRAPKPVALISRALLEDETLSFGAKGLMAYIESQADDFWIDAGVIASTFREAYVPGGLSHVQRIATELLDELIAHGYLEQQ